MRLSSLLCVACPPEFVWISQVSCFHSFLYFGGLGWGTGAARRFSFGEEFGRSELWVGRAWAGRGGGYQIKLRMC